MEKEVYEKMYNESAVKKALWEIRHITCKEISDEIVKMIQDKKIKISEINTDKNIDKIVDYMINNIYYDVNLKDDILYIITEDIKEIEKIVKKQLGIIVPISTEGEGQAAISNRLVETGNNLENDNDFKTLLNILPIIGEQKLQNIIKEIENAGYITKFEKYLKRIGYTEEALKKEFNIPEILNHKPITKLIETIANNLPVVSNINLSKEEQEKIKIEELDGIKKDTKLIAKLALQFFNIEQLRIFKVFDKDSKFDKIFEEIEKLNTESKQSKTQPDKGNISGKLNNDVNKPSKINGIIIDSYNDGLDGILDGYGFNLLTETSKTKLLSKFANNEISIAPIVEMLIAANIDRQRASRFISNKSISDDLIKYGLQLVAANIITMLPSMPINNINPDIQKQILHQGVVRYINHLCTYHGIALSIAVFMSKDEIIKAKESSRKIKVKELQEPLFRLFSQAEIQNEGTIPVSPITHSNPKPIIDSQYPEIFKEVFTGNALSLDKMDILTKVTIEQIQDKLYLVSPRGEQDIELPSKFYLDEGIIYNDIPKIIIPINNLPLEELEDGYIIGVSDLDILNEYISIGKTNPARDLNDKEIKELNKYIHIYPMSKNEELRKMLLSDKVQGEILRALENDPNTRFMIVDYKDDNNFNLVSNSEVPINYTGKTIERFDQMIEVVNGEPKLITNSPEDDKSSEGDNNSQNGEQGNTGNPKRKRK